MSAPLVGTQAAAGTLQRVHYSHDAMIDMMIERPMVSQNELAKVFGFSVAWVSRVINSDAFQARLAERKEDLVDPLLRQTFEERIKGLAAMSLEVLENKLSVTQSADMALKTFELTSKAMGLGARVERQPVLNQTFVVALPEKSQDQSEWARNARAAVDAAQRPVLPVAERVVEGG